jgi:hypothetical protein
MNCDICATFSAAKHCHRQFLRPVPPVVVNCPKMRSTVFVQNVVFEDSFKRLDKSQSLKGELPSRISGTYGYLPGTKFGNYELF